MRSELVIPLRRSHGTPPMFLDIQDDAPDRFDRDLVLLLETLADQLSVAVKNAQLFRESQYTASAMVGLVNYSQQLNTLDDQDAVLDLAIQRLPQLLKARICSIWLIDDSGDNLVLARRNHARWEPPDDVTVSLASKVPLTEPIRRAKSLYVRDVKTEYSRDAKPAYSTASCLQVLLRAGGKPLGVVNLADRRDGEPFGYADVNHASLFCGTVSVALLNSRLYQTTLELSITDGLTGLTNARHFWEVLNTEVARVGRSGAPLSLVLLDVDHFKSFNDQHGHLVGDDVLRELGKAIRSTVRATDIGARYGGEEFAIVLPDTELSNASSLAERLRARIAEIQLPGGQRFTASLGVAGYVSGDTPELLVGKADKALYAAKHGGRNRVETAIIGAK
jgi:diguanylate cyclase (GGDEF)-like protein